MKPATPAPDIQNTEAEVANELISLGRKLYVCVEHFLGLLTTSEELLVIVVVVSKISMRSNELRQLLLN